ncbi:MAG: SH3 domain-containing protein [Chloroflexi bacterium]|nr:SH3 domain-containing protein [Chloroflexota bacterium]
MSRLVRLLVLLLAIALVNTGCNLNNVPSVGSVSGAPVVQIAVPQPGASYREGIAVNISGQVTNAGADIDRVEIAIDEALATTLDAPNPQGALAFGISHTWQAAGIGEHRIAVTAFRGDGSASETALVTISVVAGDAQAVTQEVLGQPLSTATTTATRFVLPSVTPRPGQEVATAQPTTAAPTVEPTLAPQGVQPTAQPTAASASAPMASFSQGINVRRGPGLEFDPPIGSYATGQTAEILAVSTGGDWYKVRYGGTEGWVYGPLTTVTGDTSALPRDPGPPRPTARPATATPVQPTNAPAASGANLVAGIVVLNPSQPICEQVFVVGLDVANLGTQATNAGGTVTLVDTRAADGTVQGNTVGGFPIIQAGQTVRVDMSLNISTWYNEVHRLTLTIDQENIIPESDPNDNAISLEYTLNRGSCP